MRAHPSARRWIFVACATLVGCGHNHSAATPASEPSGTNDVPTDQAEQGLGLAYRIPVDARLHVSQESYDNALQDDVYLDATATEKDAEIFMRAAPCTLDYSSPTALKTSLRGHAQDVLNDAVAHQSAVAQPSAAYAVQKVPYTASPTYMPGYYFDFNRTYDADRTERLVLIADFLNPDRGCIQIKVNTKEAVRLTAERLVGRVLEEMQETVLFQPTGGNEAN